MNAENQGVSPEFTDASTTQAVQAILRFLRVLRYHKEYVLVALLVAGLLGAFYYFTATRIYEATASLMVTQNGAEVLNTGQASGTSTDAIIPTYERLFTSAVVLDGALKSLKTLPSPARIDLAGVDADDYMTKLRSSLSASAVRRTNIIELKYRSKSPDAAEAVVSAVVNSYMDFIEKNHRKLSVEIAEILRNELAKKEQELSVKQRALLELKKEAGVVIREGDRFLHPLVERAVKLNETLIEVRKQRLTLEASLAAIRSAISQGGDLRQHLLAVEPNVGREVLMNGLGLNPEYARIASGIEQKLLEERAKLQSSAAHYGPNHPRIQELQQSIEHAEQYLAQYQAQVNGRLNHMRTDQLGPLLLAMVEEKLATAWGQEQQLVRQYDLAEAEAIQLNDRVVALQLTENEVQRLQHWQDTLLDQIAGIDLQQEAGVVRVAIVSEPRALRMPVSPKLSLIVFLCVVGGLVVGIGAVYVRDLLDDRFRSPEELQQQVRAPVLAIVRSLPAVHVTEGAPVYVAQAPDSVESESFRTLRTTLAFSGEELQRVAITSPEPGDGKTTVLANLAASYAMGGKRTLLIDCDLRRPGLSKMFDVRGLGGVTDVLRSDRPVGELCQELVLESGIKRLDLLPCGPKPRDPAEILGGERFAELIAWAETHYDQVLVDCPPVMAASDAAIVARVVDGIMLVVQPEKNHRRLVLRAVESLLAFRVNLVGVIANRITDAKQGYYEYSYGYGYGYGTHYGHEEQVDEPLEAAELAEEASFASSTHPVQPEPDRFRDDLFPATRAAADAANQTNASRPRRVA